MRIGQLFFASFLAVHVSQCKSTSDRSGLKEGYDSLNSPEIFNAKMYPYSKLKEDTFRTGKLRSKPWSDTYWPLNRAGMAFRWMDRSIEFDLAVDGGDSDFDSRLKRKISAAYANAKKNVGKGMNETVILSPAEKVDLVLGRKDFPFVMHELAEFEKNATSFKDIDWNWMGHCHGWAPAAFMLPSPKSGVILRGSDGQEVFFTPGDIRGLYTKAAADYGFDGQERFMGTRCNDSAANIPVDRLKRPIDASLGLVKPGQYLSSSLPVKIELNGWSGADKVSDHSMAVVGRIGPRYSASPVVWISAVEEVDRQKNIFTVRVYSTKKVDGQLFRDQIIMGVAPAEVGTFVDELGQPIKENGNIKKDAAKATAIWQKVVASAPDELKSARSNLAFKYWKECRDTNPGAFHLVLASMLSSGGKVAGKAGSFVMDITRDDQVWNHPIYQFQSWMGSPTDLKEGQTTDPYKSWRAKGTAKIVDVHTIVGFGVENGPRIVYRPEDEAINFIQMRYTLELDHKGVVIGGEWHGTSPRTSSTPDPMSGEALLKDLRKLASSDDATLAHPDFIWGPTGKANLNDGKMIPSSLVTKLQSCAERTATQKVDVNGVSVPAVRCSL